MRAVLGCLLLLVASPATAALDCPELGVSSSYLNKFFCQQLQGIANQTGQDRSGDLSEDEVSDTAPWRSIELLDEAYSRDPKKTLALIERIKAAGGLSEN